MITTNIGMALASSNNGQTVVVDLDCVFGDVASVMGLVPEHTIGELAVLPSFDSTTVKVHLSPATSAPVSTCSPGPAVPRRARP